jgi:hypothetical protein
LNKANKFKNFDELYLLLAQNDRCYQNLTILSSSNFKRIRLVQLTFEAALKKEYENIALGLLETTDVYLTWDMLRIMLKNRSEYLVK